MDDENHMSAEYLTSWIPYETICSEAEDPSRDRILGRLEGFMVSGMIVSNDDFLRILREQEFSDQEIASLGKAQLRGIRKGMDLGYNSEEEFWEAHAERLRNLPLISEYLSEVCKG